MLCTPEERDTSTLAREEQRKGGRHHQDPQQSTGAEIRGQTAGLILGVSLKFWQLPEGTVTNRTLEEIRPGMQVWEKIFPGGDG